MSAIGGDQSLIRKLLHEHFDLRGDQSEAIDYGPPSLELPALEPVDPAAMVPLVKLRWRGVFAGQQPRCERPVGKEPKPELTTQRQLALLDVAIEQVVRALVCRDG